MAGSIDILQLSDTHFLEDGEVAEGSGSYDTDAAFEAVFADIGEHSDLDLVVVTGDVADHGRPGQYAKAAAALARFDVPVNVCPGNHDFSAPFTAGLGRPSVGTSRVIEIGNWAFLFVDSNAGVMSQDENGLLQDPDGEGRLHGNGSLGTRESAWVRQMCAATTAEYVFVWLHHPPDAPIPMTYDEAYAGEWHALLADLSIIRGFGAGHTHIPEKYELDGRPVFVAPSFKNNFSLEPQTWLPPGYCRYRFSDDGSIEQTVHLVDDERWPRAPYGRLLRSLFDGEISHNELYEIAAKRASA